MLAKSASRLASTMQAGAAKKAQSARMIVYLVSAAQSAAMASSNQAKPAMMAILFPETDAHMLLVKLNPAGSVTASLLYVP